jgi:hypothetical protein
MFGVIAFGLSMFGGAPVNALSGQSLSWLVASRATSWEVHA